MNHLNFQQYEQQTQNVCYKNKTRLLTSDLLAEEENFILLNDTVAFEKEKKSLDFKELDGQILSLMEHNVNRDWICKACGQISNMGKNRKQSMMHHVERKHIEGVSHSCSQCDQTFRYRSSVGKHIRTLHNVTSHLYSHVKLDGVGPVDNRPSTD